MGQRSVSGEYHSFWDYHMSYLQRKSTPTQVAHRILAAIAVSMPQEWFAPVVQQDVLDQAMASTERYRQGKPLSPMDGVFMAFKEDQAIKGYISTGGTTFLNKNNPSAEDSTPIARLRAAGVIVVGHTRMQEIGWDTFSINPNSGTPRNPYRLGSSCGGSSGGSAAAVAAGLVPAALGGDGGGSVRIPAAFCGAYGLKPTCGRVSGFGGLGFGASVGVTGPIAATADDMTMVFSIIQGPDAKDEKTLLPPPLDLSDYNKTSSLAGLTIGIVPKWHAEVLEPVIVDQLQKMLAYLQSLGAKVVEIELEHMDIARIAHSITISSEMNSSIRRFPKNLHEMLPVNRVLAALVNECTPTDYIRAQQIRTQMIKQMEVIFAGVDLIMTPTTAILALDFPEGCFEKGMMAGARTFNCTQFCNLANFTGIPAVSVPAGFHGEKPVAVQFMAPWFEDALLCRMAKVCEQAPNMERRRAPYSYHANFLPNGAKM
ncbi:amidase signature domain-containing protein [Gongronella butleri]|nr:amidase signature domain-containing protein [Gongronella butleri]